MINFQKIQNIKESFDDRLYQTDDFKMTKGLLYNFSSYFEKNKAILYSLLTASILNIAVNTLLIVHNSDIQLSHTFEQLTRNSESNVNQDGMDLYAKIDNFKANVRLGNSIQNHIHMDKKIHKLDAAAIKDLDNQIDGTIKVFENPFWKDNYLEINTTTKHSNHFVFPSPYTWIASKDNSLLLTDNSEQILNYNKIEAEDFAHCSDIKNTNLIKKYIVYHEAAHASFRQAFRLGANGDILRGEVHSDITSLIMIGVEYKSLQEFNEAADMLIKLRVMSLKDHDYGHNDAYAIGELKKVINDHPDLLKMKVEDISEFSYILTDTLFKENVKANNQYLLDKMGISLDRRSIFDDLKAHKNLDLYDSVGVRITHKYNFKSEDIISSGIDYRIDNFAKRIEKQMKYHMQFDAVSTLIYRDNGGNVAGTTKAIHASIQKNPIISQAIIDPIKQKIYVDGLEYDLSKVNAVRLKQKKQQQLLLQPDPYDTKNK